MILKELDPFPPTADPLQRAGRRAEERMAFYLRRAFADGRNNETFRVFNGLRLERDGDAAQIDHLVLHRYGVVLLESKSVTTEILVNEHGEWSRRFEGRERGMPSPILQAQRQARFLRLYLEAHAESLLGKVFGVLQARFGTMPIDVLVAISDEGIIKRAEGAAFPEICKADQAPDRVQSLFDRHRRDSSIFILDPRRGAYILSREELDRLTAFLLEQHRPASGNETAEVREPAPPKPAEPASPSAPPGDAPGKTCRHCGRAALAVEYGRYGYYLKCAECGGNTPITTVCAGCGGKERIRKAGKQFFAECAACNTSRLYHTNP
jgi:hypothetical protein